MSESLHNPVSLQNESQKVEQYSDGCSKTKEVDTSVNLETQETEESDSQEGDDDSNNVDGDTAQYASTPSRKRRKKRRVRLTDHAVRAKRRADRRDKLLPAKKDVSESDKNEAIERIEKNVNEGNGAEPLPKRSSIETFSHFQLLCDYFLRKFAEKDPDEIFANPVDANIAPEYYSIIKDPMDFSTIRRKIEMNKYKNLDEFKSDVNLISENAILYNQPNSFYHLAAQKLSMIAKYYFSEKYMNCLPFMVPFFKEIETELLGEISAENNETAFTIPRQNPRRNEFLLDSIKDELEEPVDRRVKSRLSRRIPNHVGYLDNKNGEIALNILTNQTNECARITLGDYLNPLEQGTSGIYLPIEPEIFTDYQISYSNPGPFASFAPQFDSTWATLSKRDTDLLLSCYGDRDNATDALALRDFVADADGMALKIVDEMLDLLTNGEHSKAMRLLEGQTENNIESPTPQPSSKQITTTKTTKIVAKTTKTGEASRRRRRRQDAITKNPTSLSHSYSSLQKTGQMIRELKDVQYQRLSFQPATNLKNEWLQPSDHETELAGKVVNELTKQVLDVGVKPGDLISPPQIHQALGLDDDDYDVLREFMVVD